MSTDTPFDWEAALADIESRIEKLQALAAGIREMIAATPPMVGPDGAPSRGVRPGAFLKMSIPDATKKHLENVRQKQSTQDLLNALEQGGLPRSKYHTFYSILRRRQRLVGDIINMQGDWALAEWYPNYRKGKTKEGDNGAAEEKPRKKQAKKAAEKKTAKKASDKKVAGENAEKKPEQAMA